MSSPTKTVLWVDWELSKDLRRRREPVDKYASACGSIQIFASDAHHQALFNPHLHWRMIGLSSRAICARCFGSRGTGVRISVPRPLYSAAASQMQRRSKSTLTRGRFKLPAVNEPLLDRRASFRGRPDAVVPSGR